MEVKVYQNKTKVAEEFSKYMIEKSAKQKTFHIALSGGSTPKIVFDVLAEEFSNDVDWKNIHRIKGENDPKAEAKRYGDLLDKELPKELGLPQFDLVILGMGDDGHTASIFPHEINLWVSPDNCEVAIHPESGQRRVSLTGRIINNAKTVAFLVTGESKAEKVKIIIDREEGYLEYPASHVAPKTKDLVWFLDAAAAKLLTSSQS